MVSLKRILKVIGIAFIVIVIVLASAIYTFLKSIGPEELVAAEQPEFVIPEPPEKDERVNVLLLGVDAGDPKDKTSPKRSDTIILASFDPVEKKLDIISIPRDTRVSIRGHGMEKIGHAHAYGGAKLAMETVSNFLGIDIHYYFRVDYLGFKKFVDSLGGVKVYVPMDMEYHDPTDDPPLHISLKKGWQVLNGEKAIQFVRYRKGYQNGDIGRIQAQQAFIDAMVDKVLSAGSIMRLPLMAQALKSHISTNMTPSEMTKYAFDAVGMGKEDIKMYCIPGEAKYLDGISYYIPDKQRTQQIISSIFGSNNNEIKVEVLNGSGVNGLAARVASMLEDEGFKVVRIGNVNGIEYNNTRVYDRKGKGDNAQKVARAIDVNMYEVDIDRDAIADVTVILGKDKGNL